MRVQIKRAFRHDVSCHPAGQAPTRADRSRPLTRQFSSTIRRPGRSSRPRCRCRRSGRSRPATAPPRSSAPTDTPCRSGAALFIQPCLRTRQGCSPKRPPVLPTHERLAYDRVAVIRATGDYTYLQFRVGPHAHRPREHRPTPFLRPDPVVWLRHPPSRSPPPGWTPNPIVSMIDRSDYDTPCRGTRLVVLIVHLPHDSRWGWF